MNEMKLFENTEFGIIRIVCDEYGNPWFCAKDVATVLGYKNTRDATCKYVEKTNKTTVVIGDSATNYKSKTVFISESGLYSLVFSSKMPCAQNFKKWVTSEVLPNIRKDGGYIIVRPGESDEDILKRTVNILQKTLEKRDKQIAKLKPRADYADAVLDSISCFTTTQIAKELNMTANELNRLLCSKRVQYGQSGQYLPYAKYARKGYARNRTFFQEKRNGRLVTYTYLVWTELGRLFIHQLIQNN